MTVQQDQRPSFYQGQYLGPDDLTTTVEYGRIQLARHSLGAHTWGIAIGLQLIEKPSPAGNNQVDVFLEPGYAWDGFGRPIVVLSPYKIPAQLFQNIVYDASVDDPTKSGDTAAGHPVKIWLSYSESANQPPAIGFEVCDVASQTSRVQETFGVKVGELTNASDQRDPISIGGKQVDALQALNVFDPNAPLIYDTSIPQQALPEDNALAMWLIPVGYVRWLPAQISTQAGSFQTRTAKDLTNSKNTRQYIGVVAGTLEAAGQNVQIKLRKNQPSGVVSDDLLWVEGKMRVEGDINLFGGKLSFLNSGGQDEGVPLLIQRAKQTNPNTLQTVTSLQVEIGSDNKGNNMFSVGPLDSNTSKFVPILNVLDSGEVGVGTTAPTGRLTLSGIVQPAQGNLTLFSQTADFEYDGGNDHLFIFSATGGAITSFLGGNIGVGTTGPTGRLTLAGIVQPAQGNLTLFSQTADFEYDGGSDHLYIFNANGNAITSFLGGNIGIGTTGPTGRLTLAGIVQPQQGNLTFFSNTADIEYDGGSDQLFIFNATGNAITSFLGGNIGIGTIGPTGRLTLAGIVQPQQGNLTFFSNTADIEYDGGSDKLFVFRGTGNANTVFIGGNFGINTNNPGVTLDVTGDIRASGGITGQIHDTSDLRLKRDILPLQNALAKLLRLRGVVFHWKEPEKMGGHAGPQMGLIAQEVEEVFPEWIKEGPDGYKLVGKRGFEALVIEAVRQLDEQLNALARQVRVSAEQG